MLRRYLPIRIILVEFFDQRLDTEGRRVFDCKNCDHIAWSAVNGMNHFRVNHAKSLGITPVKQTEYEKRLAKGTATKLYE